jgi:hypothetical protein
MRKNSSARRWSPEARAWLGTPYRHMARVKGHGADCAMFPLEVYASLGLITPAGIPYYPLDWHLHRSAERYLDIVRTLAHEVARRLSGPAARRLLHREVRARLRARPDRAPSGRSASIQPSLARRCLRGRRAIRSSSTAS